MIKEVNDINGILPFIIKYFPNYKINNNPYEKNYIYEINDKIIGFISYSIIYENVELNYILVDEHFRKKGIGQKLLDNCLKHVKESITLEVSVNNKEAINFYIKNKFKIVSTRKNYYKDSDGYLMMRKMWYYVYFSYWI